MKKISYFSILYLLLVACNSQAPVVDIVTEIHILPKPSELRMEEGTAGFLIQPDMIISFDKALEQEAQLLSEYLAALKIHAKLREGEFDGPAIKLQLNNFDVEMEFYTFTSRQGQLLIDASSKIGIKHGIQSLRQILLAEYKGRPIQLPAFTLADKPQFLWRGMLLDCSRHFMEVDFVKKYIDLLALHKMNRLHWHLTEDQGWRIEIKKYPKLTEVGAWRDDGKGGKYGGFYTQAQIRDIVKYAEARGVTIVPEIELPGHSQAALAAYPQFSCTGGPFEVQTEWGVFKEIYCAGNDSTFQFLEDIMTEVLDLFPSPYIHIGGDEVPKFRWEHCDKCQKRIKDNGLHNEHELQSYFIQHFSKFLQSRGRTLIGWDEILEGGLAEGAIVQSWRGFDGAAAAVKAGHPAIVSPTSHAYFDYGLNDINLEKVYSFHPVPEGLSDTAAALIWGGECNMWTERAPQELVDSKVFPRILAMAEVLWAGNKKKDFPAFKMRVHHHYKVLDKLGIDYGLEAIPVQVNTQNKEGKLWVSLIEADTFVNTRCKIGKENFIYEKPFAVEASDTLILHFDRNGRTLDYVLSQLLQAHKALGITPTLSYEFHPNYTAGGASGLCDGKKGSSDFKDGNWQGCWGDDMEVVVDLGENKAISQLSSGFLQYNNAWIFFPQKVEYWLSEDGKNYRKAGQADNPVSPKEKAQETREFSLSLENTSARFVKMKAHTLGICPDWHDAAGSKAWLFLDELTIN